MQLTENKKILIAMVSVFILSLTAFIVFDNIDGLFKNHEVNTTTDQPAAIIVNGDGSSGTGDVQNVQQVTQVTQAGKSAAAVTTVHKIEGSVVTDTSKLDAES